MQDHEIFQQFSDYCAEKPGMDKKWTVGTEFRQLQIYEPELATPGDMKRMMVDHLKRRYFIIDADVKVIVNAKYFISKTAPHIWATLCSLHFLSILQF